MLDKVGKLYNPRLDDLDMEALMEDSMDSELVKKTGCRCTSRGSFPRETEDYGDPEETRDPG